jgi:hypothetical protein
MKKHIIPLLIGIAVSYCFSSMILNARIVNPIVAFHNRSIVFGVDELFADMNGFEIIAENRLRSTAENSWLEVGNIQERVGRLRSVTYKVKMYNVNYDVKTMLYYADTEQDFSAVRYLTATFEDNFALIEIPDYAGPIDKLRLQLKGMNGIIIEIEEISLNRQTRFSLPLMAFVYLLWCMVVLLNPESRDNTADNAVAKTI